MGSSPRSPMGRACATVKTWMPGTRPGMTLKKASVRSLIPAQWKCSAGSPSFVGAAVVVSRHRLAEKLRRYGAPEYQRRPKFSPGLLRASHTAGCRAKIRSQDRRPRRTRRRSRAGNWSARRPGPADNAASACPIRSVRRTASQC